jgi:hypothetical protein
MLINALQDVRRRVKVLGVTYGIACALTIGVGLLLLTIFVDYLLNLPAWPRTVLFLAALAGISYAVARWVWKPAAAKLSLSDVAGRLERAFPQFDDRLRSTVDFAAGSPAYGSDIMQRRVVSEAAELASRLDLSQAVELRPVWQSSAAAASAIVLALVLALLAPTYSRIAIARLLNPFGGAAWPKRVEISMVGEVPRRIPVGQRFDIKMRLTKGDRASTKARVFYQLDDGSVQQEFMQRTADGTYVASLDAKADPTKSAGLMKIWMTAGDDRKELQPITVLPRLAIARVEASITPPAYVAAAANPTPINLAEGPAMTAAGSEIALRIAFNKTLAEGAPVKLQSLVENVKVPQISWQHIADGTIVGKWLASESLRFHVLATDTDGFANSAIEEYEVIVRPDQNPVVQIENPRRNEERTPVAVVPLQGIAEDDYGINSLKLIIDRLGDKKHWEIPLVENAKAREGVTWTSIESSADRLRHRANYAWDLAKLEPAGLKSGDVLEYSLQVTDNYKLANQTHAPVSSGKLRITIVSQEQFTDIITGEMRQAAEAIKNVHTRQGSAKQSTADLARETEKKPEFDKADREIAEKLSNQQSAAASQAKQIAGKLDAIKQRMEENKSPSNELKQLANDVKDLLNNVAENPMKDAAAQIASAAQQNDPAKRNETMNSAGENQQRATDQLQTALDKMGSVGSLAQTIEKIRDLLKQQQEVSKATADVGSKNLGKRPDQMSPEDRAKLEKAADDQQRLAAKTDKAIADMNKLADQLKKSDPASSEAMKQAAQTGSTQQVSPNQSKAAAAAKQNQQANAQAAQKQAELGLQMMLTNLKEAERRKLEELSKKLAEIQQQIAILIRRQAGHNLDNLGLQQKPVEKLDAKLAEELLNLAQRVKGHLPTQPQLPQLTTSQEQTERNTRDIAQTVEQMPSGAEPASNLSRASTKMQRAIVELRGKKLAEAYEPPQIDALAALIDAKKIVDEQKNKADQQLEQQQKEAVRQAYIKIKAEQEKLNAETARIDQSPRDAQKNLNRADAIRLGALPGEQGKLSDKTQELEEALAAVDSIVYIWANKDIVTSMNQVKDDLGKPSTGAETQAEQKRLVEQLDEMIKNLEIKPLESKFAQKNNGGGGGGGGGPKLPSEAELRLLKALQSNGINRETKVLDKQDPKDPRKFLSVGNRQGEFRNLLDQVLQKNSGGEVKLRAEPDPKDQLPDEANKEQIEQQELEQALKGDAPDADAIDKEVQQLGDRMARSRQRLALNNDAGKTTQTIQERILKDFDALIEQARKQNAQSSGQPKPGQGQQMVKADAQSKQAQNVDKNAQVKKRQGGTTPKPDSLSPGQSGIDTDLSQQIKQSAAEWGQISPRTRNAVMEGADEKIIEKYRKYAEDYYRGVSVKGTERQ